MNDLLTVRDIALMLKLSEKTVYRMVADGKIPGFKAGGSWRFDKIAIARWMKRNEVGNG